MGPLLFSDFRRFRISGLLNACSPRGACPVGRRSVQDTFLKFFPRPPASRFGASCSNPCRRRTLPRRAMLPRVVNCLVRAAVGGRAAFTFVQRHEPRNCASRRLEREPSRSREAPRAAISLIAATNQTRRVSHCEQTCSDVAPKSALTPLARSVRGEAPLWQSERCSSSIQGPCVGLPFRTCCSLVVT